ncbi:MAG: phosphodiester glycosidase family protein, partial [bacterium]|nr:phosphodiester glycosidase family protein [bacterium]
PPGALPANTDITMEKVPDSAGGSLVGDVYFLGPDGLKLNAPVLVRLPYDPSKIPADSTEADLVLTSNFERIKGTEINTDEHVVVAPVSHFSPHWPETWKEHPVPLGPTNGILHYPHYTDWTSYNVFLIDLNESSQKLKVLLAPDSGKGDGSRYLRTVKEMVESAETQLIGGNSIPLAINGWTWDGEEGRQIVCDATDCLGWLNSSTYVDGEEKLFCVSDATGLNLGPVDSQCLSEKKDEVEEKLIFSNSGPTEAAIGQWNNKNDLPHKWGVMGSTILVTSNGEFAPTDEYLADRPRLTEYNARTAVGINKARSKLIFFVGGRDVLDDGPPSRGINIRSVHNKLKEFGADRVLLLDGGYSTSLLLNGEEQYSVLGLARNVISGLAVVQSPIITPPGPQPVAVEDPVQGQITVGQCDMGDPFCLLGPSDFWFSKEGLGSGGHMWWTYANETPNAVNKNQAKWIPNILASGVYRVEAFIPSNCATTTCARYKIAHNGQTHCKVINQYNISTDVTGEYAYLGKFRFQAGTGGNVALDDVTYEKWITVTSPARQVGVDLIRFVPVDGNAEEAEACDDSKFQVDCSKVVSKSTPCRP